MLSAAVLAHQSARAARLVAACAVIFGLGGCVTGVAHYTVYPDRSGKAELDITLNQMLSMQLLAQNHGNLPDGDHLDRVTKSFTDSLGTGVDFWSTRELTKTEAGTVHDYVRDTKVTPTKEVWFGNGTVDLARRGHVPGRVRVVAVFSNAKVDEQAVRDAIARLDPRRADSAADADAGVVRGLLVIEP